MLVPSRGMSSATNVRHRGTDRVYRAVIASTTWSGFDGVECSRGIEEKSWRHFTCITAARRNTAELITFGWNFPSALIAGSSSVICFSHRARVATRQDRWIMNCPATDTVTERQKTLLGGLEAERFCSGLAYSMSTCVCVWVWERGKGMGRGERDHLHRVRVLNCDKVKVNVVSIEHPW